MDQGKLVVTVDADKAMAEIARLAEDIRQSVDRFEALLARFTDEEDEQGEYQRFKRWAREAIDP